MGYALGRAGKRTCEARGPRGPRVLDSFVTQKVAVVAAAVGTAPGPQQGAEDEVPGQEGGTRS